MNGTSGSHCSRVAAWRAPDPIDSFTSFFAAEISNLQTLIEPAARVLPGSIDLPRRHEYAKVLTVALLDALAAIRFPRSTHPEFSRRNRERFIRFVSDFANWPEGRLVSAAVLERRLDVASFQGRLMSHICEILSRRDTNEGNSEPLAAFDEPPEVLLPLAQTEAEERMIWRTQHLSLLYDYRNRLLHEFRSPGYGSDFMCDDAGVPCYHGHIGCRHWRLAYPAGFFIQLATTALCGLETWLRQEALDPYQRLPDTSDW